MDATALITEMPAFLHASPILNEASDSAGGGGIFEEDPRSHSHFLFRQHACRFGRRLRNGEIISDSIEHEHLCRSQICEHRGAANLGLRLVSQVFPLAIFRTMRAGGKMCQKVALHLV